MGVCASISTDEDGDRVRRGSASRSASASASNYNDSDAATYSYPRGFFARFRSQKPTRGRGRSSSFGESDLELQSPSSGNSLARDSSANDEASVNQSANQSNNPNKPNHNRAPSLSSVSDILRASKIDSGFANGSLEGPDSRDDEIVKPNGNARNSVVRAPPTITLTHQNSQSHPLPTLPPAAKPARKRRKKRSSDPEVVDGSSTPSNDPDNDLPFGDEEDEPVADPNAPLFDLRNPFDRLLLQSPSDTNSHNQSQSNHQTPVHAPLASNSSSLANSPHMLPAASHPSVDHTQHQLHHSLSTSHLPSSTLQSFVNRVEDSILPSAQSKSKSNVTLLVQPSTPPPQAREPNFALSPAVFMGNSNSPFMPSDLESFEHDRINFLKRGSHFIAHVITRRNTGVSGVIKSKQHSLSCQLSCTDLRKIVISSESGPLSFYFTEPNPTQSLLSSSSPPHSRRHNPVQSTLTTATSFFSSSPVPTYAVVHPTSDLLDACAGLHDVSADALAKHRKHTPLFDPSCCFTIFFLHSSPLYLQARSVDDRNIWLNALLWLKDLTNEDLRESLFLFQRDTLAIDNDRRRRDSDSDARSTTSATGKLGGKTGKYATFGSASSSRRQSAIVPRERNQRASSVSSAALLDVAMKSVQVRRDTSKGELLIRADHGRSSSRSDILVDQSKSAAARAKALKITTELKTKPRAHAEYDFLTGPSLDATSLRQDQATDVLAHGQIFSYYHNRQEQGELIFLSCDESLQNIRYGRLTEAHCAILHTTYPPQLPVQFPQPFVDSFPYDHVIPSSTISDVITGEACLLFGAVKWPFSVYFHTYKGIPGKVKQMHFSVFSSSERLTWVKSLKWLKDHKSNVGIPYNVHRVAYLDTDLQWKSNSDKELLDQFSIEPQGLLGKGGFASVFLATHTPTRAKFAIKIFNNFNVTIQNEINILKEIRHENVVSYYGCFPTSDQKMYVIMEYCDAGSLHDLLSARLKVKVKERHISYVLRCTLAALSYLHSRNIIHRDIKSANILLKKNGAVKLVDFGIAAKRKPISLTSVPVPTVTQFPSTSASPSNPYLTLNPEDLTISADLIGGSPLWMSVEAIKGEKVDFKADSWSLGITAIEIAEGKPPYHDLPNFHSVAYEICYSDPPSLSTHAPSYKNASPEFNDFVNKCLIKDRTERWSIQQLLAHPFITKYNSPPPNSSSPSGTTSSPHSPLPSIRRGRANEAPSSTTHGSVASRLMPSFPSILTSPSAAAHAPQLISPSGGSPATSGASPASPVTEIDDSFRILLEHGTYIAPALSPQPSVGHSSPFGIHIVPDPKARSPVPSFPDAKARGVTSSFPKPTVLPGPSQDIKKRQRHRRDTSIDMRLAPPPPQIALMPRDGEIFPDLVPVESLVLTAGSTLAQAAAAFSSFVKRKEEAMGGTVTSTRTHRRKKSLSSLRRTHTIPIAEEDEDKEEETLYLYSESPAHKEITFASGSLLTTAIPPQPEFSPSGSEHDRLTNDAMRSSSPPSIIPQDSSSSMSPLGSPSANDDSVPITRPPFALKALKVGNGDDDNDDQSRHFISPRLTHSSPSPTHSQVRFKPALKLALGDDDEDDDECYQEEEGEIQTFEVAASPSHMLREQRAADENRRGGRFALSLGQDRPLDQSYLIGQDGAFVSKGIKVTAQGIQATNKPLETIQDSPNRSLLSDDDQRSSPLADTSAIPSIALNKHDLVRLGVIGKGQNGQVYKAIHLPTLTRVALKSMNIYEKGTRHQLLHELSAYASLQSPYLVAFLGAYHEAGVITVASEYMDCGSLQSFVKHFGAIRDEMLIKLIAKQSVLGLSYLHAHHRVHRDIKPDNILLNVSGQCRLADFGLLTELESTLAFTDTFLGTLAYLSPERLQSSRYSYKSDIWSLGLSLLFMVNGSLPLQCADYWQMLDLLSKEPPKLDTSLGFSDEFADFIDQCLRIEEDARASASELLRHPFLADVMTPDFDRGHVRARQCIENAMNKHAESSGDEHEAGYSIGNNSTDLCVILDLIIEKHLLHLSDDELQRHASAFQTSSQQPNHMSLGSDLTLFMPPKLLRQSTTLDSKRLAVLADQFNMDHRQIQHLFLQRQALFQEKQDQQ